MSYGLYADTTATLGQIKQEAEKRELECDYSSEVPAFRNDEGSVEMGWHTEDNEVITTMCIRGNFEPTMREIILAIDPNATICDEEEMFEDDDEGLFDNDAVQVVSN